MRLLFDCRSVFPGMGGIGRSTAALARALPPALPDAEVHLLFGARRPPEPLVRARNVVEHDVAAGMVDAFFEQIQLPGLIDDWGIDVYHGTCFAVPLAASHVRRVATVHDVVFRRHPDLVDEPLRGYLDRWTDVACEVADAVITVSEFSRREIVALYGADPEEVRVVPNAVDERFFGVERRRPRAPYVLYVGSIEAKKNVAALVAGFAASRRRDPELPHRLALVGGRGGARFDLDACLAEHPEVADRVDVLGHVADDRLLDLYAGADLFCYLSEYEGFGLPPLEAMAAGTPCVVAERSCLPEVVEDAALLCDPARPADVADALLRALTDAALRDDLVEKGRARARSFSWDDSARDLAALYADVLSPARSA